MLQEIAQQPDVLEGIAAVNASALARLKNHLVDRQIDLIVLVARGSSDNAALFGRYLLELTTGIPVSLAAPSVVTLYDVELRLRNALVIGVSQSGQGSDINFVLESAGKSGALTLAFTNDADSKIVEVADESFLIHAGPEVSVAATKTYTGQMMLFYLIAESLGAKPFEYRQITDFAHQALELSDEIRELAERYVFMENCVVLGRGLNYGNAFELGLKLMETCYVVAERFSSADFQHGPLALIERRFPVILYSPQGVTRPGDMELLDTLSSLHADTLVITNDVGIARASSRAINLCDKIPELLTPIPFIIPAQLFAAHLSQAKGLDADKPRTIRKVTQTL